MGAISILNNNTFRWKSNLEKRYFFFSQNKLLYIYEFEEGGDSVMLLDTDFSSDKVICKNNNNLIFEWQILESNLKYIKILEGNKYFNLERIKQEQIPKSNRTEKGLKKMKSQANQ